MLMRAINIPRRILYDANEFPPLERAKWVEYFSCMISYFTWLIYLAHERFLLCVRSFQGFHKLWRAVTIEQMGILTNGFHHWKEQTE